MDQNGPSGTTTGIPARYANNTTVYWGSPIPQCTNDYDNSSTLLNKAKGLYGNNNQKISNQVSCKPYPDNPGLNAGNWYNFPAATAGSDNHAVTRNTEVSNSICPKGWQLPPNDSNKSYYNLIRNIYQIADGPSGSIDTNLLANTAMSFAHLGNYAYDYGSLNNRGVNGFYWSSTAYSATNSRHLGFNSGSLSSQGGNPRAIGFSIRCVSR